MNVCILYEVFLTVARLFPAHLLPGICELYRAVEHEVGWGRVWVNIIVAYTLELQVVHRLACLQPFFYVGFLYLKAVGVEEWAHGLNASHSVVLLGVGGYCIAWVLYHP